MQISCKQCKKKYKLPEERVPYGKIVKIKCPNCGSPILVDLQQVPDNGQAASAAPMPESAEAPPAAPAGQPVNGTELKEKILKSLKELPPMPQVVFKAQDAISDRSSDLRELSDIIKTDPALVMKILKIANSAFYGMSGKVGTIERATVLLGQKTIGEIITMAGVSKLLDSELKGYDLAPGDLWLHSMGVAFASKMLADMKHPAIANDCFVAGLLHDAGKIVLNEPIFERKKAFDKLIEKDESTVIEAENAVLGFDHSEIAFEMCQRWKIPEPIAKAIHYHHFPSRSKQDELAYILHLADYIATLSGIGIGPDDIRYEAEEGTTDFLGVTQKTVSEIVFKLMESINEFSSMHSCAA